MKYSSGFDPYGNPYGFDYSMYEFEIQFFCYGTWECVHTVETRNEAEQSLKEYRENQPGIYRIKKVKT